MRPTIGPMKDMREIMMKTRLMGCFMNIEGSPWEMMSDILRCSSRAGPRIMAKSIGTTGNSYFLMKYPNSPKKSMTPVSKKVLCRAYDPTMQRIAIIGRRILFGTWRSLTQTFIVERVRKRTIIFATRKAQKTL